ncbi:cg30 [Palpita vitrealis nucleopolyhedrovirus]|uniref:Cg30 n=1 Tax=Palpita vitrealis nucleopolyhedrovirus TaxID=2951960 RepID=A0AAE9RZ40_9ABAC|nr:cg30 [Palpita vitrealis nucleopolyhedrovirus]
MEFVKLQCNICFSVSEIKNYHLQPVDRLNIIAILELDTCKHQLCSLCIRKIRKQKKLPCPLCRVNNLYFNIYSVNRNIVDVIKCNVANIVQWNKSNDDLDAASVAALLFEKSLLDASEDYETVNINDSQLQTTLNKLQLNVFKQNQLNAKQKLIFDDLQETNKHLQTKLNSIRSEYNSINKLSKELQLKRILMEKSIKILQEDHAKLAAKNVKLSNENKILSNKNIELIKHKNLLQKEYLNQKSHTFTYTTNVTYM